MSTSTSRSTTTSSAQAAGTRSESPLENPNILWALCDAAAVLLLVVLFFGTLPDVSKASSYTPHAVQFFDRSDHLLMTIDGDEERDSTCQRCSVLS